MSAILKQPYNAHNIENTTLLAETTKNNIHAPLMESSAPDDNTMDWKFNASENDFERNGNPNYNLSNVITS